MSFQTGITRLGKVVKGFGVLAGLASLVVSSAAFLENNSEWGVFLLLGIVVLTVCWAVGWVLEGFGKE